MMYHNKIKCVICVFFIKKKDVTMAKTIKILKDVKIRFECLVTKNKNNIEKIN